MSIAWGLVTWCTQIPNASPNDQTSGAMGVAGPRHSALSFEEIVKVEPECPGHLTSPEDSRGLTSSAWHVRIIKNRFSAKNGHTTDDYDWLLDIVNEWLANDDGLWWMLANKASQLAFRFNNRQIPKDFFSATWRENSRELRPYDGGWSLWSLRGITNGMSDYNHPPLMRDSHFREKKCVIPAIIIHHHNIHHHDIHHQNIHHHNIHHGSPLHQWISMVDVMMVDSNQGNSAGSPEKKQTGLSFQARSTSLTLGSAWCAVWINIPWYMLLCVTMVQVST